MKYKQNIIGLNTFVITNALTTQDYHKKQAYCRVHPGFKIRKINHLTKKKNEIRKQKKLQIKSILTCKT